MASTGPLGCPPGLCLAATISPTSRGGSSAITCGFVRTPGTAVSAPWPRRGICLGRISATGRSPITWTPLIGKPTRALLWIFTWWQQMSTRENRFTTTVGRGTGRTWTGSGHRPPCPWRPGLWRWGGTSCWMEGFPTPFPSSIWNPWAMTGMWSF